MGATSFEKVTSFAPGPLARETGEITTPSTARHPIATVVNIARFIRPPDSPLIAVCLTVLPTLSLRLKPPTEFRLSPPRRRGVGSGTLRWTVNVILHPTDHHLFVGRIAPANGLRRIGVVL